MFKRILDFFFRIYLEHTICQHFCLFKEIKSKFKNTHVHFLIGDRNGQSHIVSSLDGTNPMKYTGLGHQDEADYEGSEAHHNTLSTLLKCEFKQGGGPTGTIDATQLGLRQVFTAWFHPAPESGNCPEGYKRANCKCGPVCYTFDIEAYDAWRG